MQFQNDARDDLLLKDEIKVGSIPGNVFFYFSQDFSLECRLYSNEIIPQEHSILSTRKISVVASV